jgi:hypothetical protein
MNYTSIPGNDIKTYNSCVTARCVTTQTATRHELPLPLLLQKQKKTPDMIIQGCGGELR